MFSPPWIFVDLFMPFLSLSQILCARSAYFMSSLPFESIDGTVFNKPVHLQIWDASITDTYQRHSYFWGTKLYSKKDPVQH
ncbi:hypothetical protein BJY52DRAFT_1265057 [Lactarius psammicola]|nr:hypothetical protein BJY52DRAFT_1265057 [Lactarius psammicola]